MHKTAKKRGNTRRLMLAGLISLLVAVLLLTAYSTAIPLAHAQESDAPAATPPAGDCWGGVLSDDPLHCYALEEAQRDGVIVVEGLYLVGNELRVYFRFASDSTTYFALPDILRANAREFAIQHPGRVTYNFGDHRCSGGDGEASSRDCMLDYTFRGYVNRCVNDIRRRPSQPLSQRRSHPRIERRDRRLRSTQGPSDA